MLNTFLNGLLEQTAGLGALGLGRFLPLLIIVPIAIVVLSIFINWKLFAAADESGWKAIIPIYNAFVETRIVWGRGIYFLFLLIPGINIAFSIAHSIKKAKVYNRGILFGIGLLFLPIIFGLILVLQVPKYLGPDDEKLKLVLLIGLGLLALSMVGSYVAASKLAAGGFESLPIGNVADSSVIASSSEEEPVNDKEITQFYLSSADKEQSFEVEKGTPKQEIIDQLPMTMRVSAGGEQINVLVDWDSEAYTENEYGEYIFDMILPEGFTVAEGTDIPYYTVSINPPEDEIVETESTSAPEEEEETMTQTSEGEEEEEEVSEASVSEEPSGPPAQIPQEQSGTTVGFIILSDKDNAQMAQDHSTEAAFLTGNGGGSKWLSSDGVDRAVNLAAEGATIVIIPGTESMDDPAAYAEAANKASQKLGMISGNVYMTSVPPTGNETMNESIRTFNDRVYEALDDTVGYVDLYYKLAKDGFSNASDGITLDASSASKAFQYIKQATGK